MHQCSWAALWAAWHASCSASHTASHCLPKAEAVDDSPMRACCRTYSNWGTTLQASAASLTCRSADRLKPGSFQRPVVIASAAPQCFWSCRYVMGCVYALLHWSSLKHVVRQVLPRKRTEARLGCLTQHVLWSMQTL